MDLPVIADVGNGGAAEATSVVRKSPKGNGAVGDTDMQSFLLPLYECPICLAFAVLPIPQCNRGHILCISCYGRMTMCPVCREPLSHTQPSLNLTMQQMATRIMFPCKFAKVGCNKMSYGLEKSMHEKSCDFRPCLSSISLMEPSVIPEVDECGANAATSDIRTTTKGNEAVGDADIQSFLLSLYVCPACLDFALPTIEQCVNGHLLCHNCQSSRVDCFTCQVPLKGSIRNLIMEWVASKLVFPCKFLKMGCGRKLQYNHKRKHEMSCEFQSICCSELYPGCTWEGQYQELAIHVVSVHQTFLASFQTGHSFNASIDIQTENNFVWKFTQACFGHHFIHNIFRSTTSSVTRYIHIVQLVDPGIERPEHFSCCMEFTGVNRRLVYECPPRPMYSGLSAAIENKDGLIVQDAVVKKLAQDGKLSIRFVMKNTPYRSDINGPNVQPGAY